MRALRILPISLVLVTPLYAQAGGSCEALARDYNGVLNCIKTVGAGGEVILSDGVHWSDPISIDGDVTIRANNTGKSILRNGRMFEVNSVSIFDRTRHVLPAEALVTILSGLVKIEGVELLPPGVPVATPRLVVGRAIEVHSGNVTLRDVKVSGHQAYKGTFDNAFPIGGLAMLQTGGHVTVDGGEFSDLGGGELLGGAFSVTSGSDLVFAGAPQLLRNTAQKGAAVAVFSAAKVTFGGSKDVHTALIDNSSNWGGAVYANAADVHVVNGTFWKNHALEREGQGGEGGHIRVYDGGLVIEGGSFQLASALYGGGIFAVGSDVRVEGAMFEQNQAAQGGAIFSSNVERMQSINIVNSSFTHNKGGYVGGAIAVSGTELIIENSTFLDNGVSGSEPSLYGGTIVCWDGVVDMLNTTVEGGRAEVLGGGLAAWDCTVDVQGGAWKNNKVIDELSYGGALVGIRSDVALTDVDFSDNNGVWGGAVFVEGLSTLAIRGGRFFQNGATTGGALVTRVDLVDISDTIWESNYAGDSGGTAVFLGGTDAGLEFAGDVLLQGIQVFDSRSLGAGAMWGTQVNVSILGGAFYDNHATGVNAVGGAYTQQFGTLELSNVTFRGNGAKIGGAVAAVELDEGWIHDNTFLRNEAEQAGAVSLDGGALQYVERNVFCGNKSPASAADLMVTDGRDLNDSSANVAINNNLFDANGARSATQVGVSRHMYYVHNNNFVHAEHQSLTLGETAGRVERNLFGWNIGQPTVGFLKGASNVNMYENAWWDPTTDDRTWIADADEALPLSIGHVAANPQLMGALDGLDFPVDDCVVANHYPMATSPLLGGRYHDDPRGHLIGMFGGEGADDLVWVTDADDDGVVLLFDCDDEDASVNE
ncbi:MAG: putative outer membrane repeat protein, partial [Kiritimatiellia bacterium]